MKASEHESYWNYTILTLILPIVGFILGLMYMSKDDKPDRKLGEHLLAMSILLGILYGGIWYWYSRTHMPTPPVIYYGIISR